jgi:DNA polymerase-3 subunit delta
VWGVKERLFERVLPGLPDHAAARLVEAAHLCDGIVKGLKHPDWPHDPWDALQRLLLMLMQHTSPAASPAARRTLALAP